MEMTIEAHELRKRFGKTKALDGLDLAVPKGSILGLLGPNGAGKTTAVRILTTLSAPDSGSARVAGFDVVSQAGEVRGSIGLAAQDATVDRLLTGRENLVMIGRLSGLPRRETNVRAIELLAQFDLSEAADRVLADLLRRNAQTARPRGEPRDAPAGALPRSSPPRVWTP